LVTKNNKTYTNKKLLLDKVHLDLVNVKVFKLII